MILCSHQPNFFPYLGLFYNMYNSDFYVFSDDVQFAKKNFQNYTNIKSSVGGTLRLTVPIKSHTSIYKDVEISYETDWQRKMLMSIEQSYSKSKYFAEVFPEVENVINHHHKYLVDLNMQSILFAKERFGINTDFCMASILNHEGHKDERILNLCKSVNADVYLSGLGAKVYHKDENFKDIKLEYTNYKPLVYKQGKGDFIENLSVLDYLFNEGFVFPKEWQNEKK